VLVAIGGVGVEARKAGNVAPIEEHMTPREESEEGAIFSCPRPRFEVKIFLAKGLSVMGGKKNAKGPGGVAAVCEREPTRGRVIGESWDMTSSQRKVKRYVLNPEK